MEDLNSGPSQYSKPNIEESFTGRRLPLSTIHPSDFLNDPDYGPGEMTYDRLQEAQEMRHRGEYKIGTATAAGDILPKPTEAQKPLRPGLLNLISSELKPRGYENFMNAARVFAERMRPEAIIGYPTEVGEAIASGNTIVMCGTHFSFLDIPAVLGTMGAHLQETPKTRAVVAKMPDLLFPPDAFPVWFQWEDIVTGMKSDISENRSAAIGNYWLSHIMAGGFIISEDDKRHANDAMVQDATNHMAQENGNVVIWPTGPGMIGRWRSGGARIIQGAMQQSHPGKTNIVFAHLGTFPGMVTNSILRKSDYPVTIDYRMGPSQEQLELELSRHNLSLDQDSRKVAPVLNQILARSFFGQEDQFHNLIRAQSPKDAEFYIDRLKGIYQIQRADMFEP